MHRTEGYKNKDNKFEDLETVITADPLNAWQEEIANVVESSGIELNSAATEDWKQLGPAIANYVQNGRYYWEDIPLSAPNAYVLKVIDISVGSPPAPNPAPTHAPSKYAGGDFLWLVTNAGTGGSTTLQLPGDEVKALIRFDGSAPQITDLPEGAYVRVRYGLLVHTILETYHESKGPDIVTKIINTQDIPVGIDYPAVTTQIPPDSWQYIYFNTVTYNTVTSGVVLAELGLVTGWGDVAKDIIFQKIGKYIVHAIIPWRAVAGENDDDYALRFYDLTNTTELLRSTAHWGDSVGHIYGIIEITNPPITLNIQRYTRSEWSVLVRNGGISDGATRTSITAEVNIQKIA